MKYNKKIVNNSLNLLILFISLVSISYIANMDLITTIYAKAAQNSSNNQENILAESSEEYIDVEDKYSDEIYYASITSIILVIIGIIITVYLYRHQQNTEKKNVLNAVEDEVIDLQKFHSQVKENKRKNGVYLTPAYNSIVNSGYITKLSLKSQKEFHELYSHIQVRNDIFLYIDKFEDLEILYDSYFKPVDNKSNLKERLEKYYENLEELEKTIFGDSFSTKNEDIDNNKSLIDNVLDSIKQEKK